MRQPENQRVSVKRQSYGFNPISLEVTKVFHTGLAVCPDIVLLAFLQLPVSAKGLVEPKWSGYQSINIQGPLTDSRLTLMNVFVPHLIATHYNVVPVLNVMWNSPLSKRLMHGIIISVRRWLT